MTVRVTGSSSSTFTELTRTTLHISGYIKIRNRNLQGDAETDLDRIERTFIEFFDEDDGIVVLLELDDDHGTIRRDVTDKAQMLHGIRSGRYKSQEVRGRHPRRYSEYGDDIRVLSIRLTLRKRLREGRG